MDEPEKVTDSVSEAQTEPVMEETETETDVVVVVKAEAEAEAEAETDVSKAEAETEAEGQAPMDTETEPTKLVEDEKSPAQLVGNDPDSVEQEAVEDTSEKTLNVVGSDAQNEGKTKCEETVGEEKILAETDTKMDGVEHDDNGDGPVRSHDNGLCGPKDDDHGIDNGEELKDLPKERDVNMQLALTIPELGDKNSNLCFDNSGSDSEEEQAAFVKEVEAFYKEKHLEFKHPKFYKEDLNLLKLWRAVIKLGGYEQVTSCKLWRQVGESFNPPKTCTTVSWTFRIFYEKALLEYEKHKIHGGELPHSDAPFIEPNGVETQAGSNQAPGSGRAKRDAAARAMKSWHSQRVLDNGEVCHPIIKDKTSSPALKSDKQLKNFGLLKRKKPSILEPGVRVSQLKSAKPQYSFGRLDTMVVDIGASADWVKVNVQKTVDCYEVYALVPGLLREEVHVQSDPAGRLVISGQPKQLDNPWGVTPFKKVVSLPSRIDPHQTSAVVTLHGQLFVRVPFEVPDI